MLLCSAAFFCVCAAFSVLLKLGLWPALLWCGIGAFLLGAAALLLCGGRFMAVTAGLLFGLICCGAHGFLSWQPAQELSGAAGECRVALTDYAEGRGGWGAAWGTLRSVGGSEADCRVKVLLQDGSPEYRPGDLLVFDGKIRAASVSVGDGLLQQGVFVTVRQTGPVECRNNGASTVFTRLRRLAGEIRARISLLLTGDEAGLMTALLTGDESGCSASLLAALNTTGLRHATSVSGLHLSILAAFLIRVLGKRAGVWLALPTVVTYAAIAGFPASAVRAAVMQGFVLAAFLMKRDNDSSTALSASLLLLCAINPFSSVSASLLLSFSATAGILWLYPGLARRLSKRRPQTALPAHLYRYAADTLAVSLSAMVCTLPVSLLWFGSASLIAVPMNILCLWAVSLSMLLGIAAVCVSALIPAAASAAAWILYWPLRYLTTLIGAAGRLPFAAAKASLYLALGTAALFLLLLLLRKGEKKGLVAGGLALCLCFALSALENRLTTAVDISGEGGAVMLALHSRGENALVGGGGSDEASARFIRETAVRRGGGTCEFLLAAGSGWRQTGGIRGALEAARPEELMLPSGTPPPEGDRDNAVWYTDAGSIRLGELTVSLLPVDNACCCHISGAGMSLLSVCGAEPWAVLSAISGTRLKASVLVIDGGWKDAPAALRRLCAFTGAETLILSDDAWSYAPDTIYGIPVVSLYEAKTVMLETMR